MHIAENEYPESNFKPIINCNDKAIALYQRKLLSVKHEHQFDIQCKNNLQSGE